MPEEQKTVETTPQIQQPLEEKVLHSWSAAARPFKRGSREFYVKAASVGVLLSIILFLIEGALPVILLISIGFLVYVYMSVEPGHINYAITNLGIKVHNKTTPWHDLGHFWFSHRLGSELLIVEAAVFGGRLEMVIIPEEEAKIKEVLSKHLIYQPKPPTNTDKIINWVSTKILS